MAHDLLGLYKGCFVKCHTCTWNRKLNRNHPPPTPHAPNKKDPETYCKRIKCPVIESEILFLTARKSRSNINIDMSENLRVGSTPSPLQ